MSAGDITFLVEFPKGEASSFESTSVTIHTDPKGAVIHAITTAPHPTSSYWIDWGGSYDNPTDSFFAMFVSRFLRRVDTIEELLLTEFSSRKVGDTTYIRTPAYPWQYDKVLRRLEFLYGFSSNVADPLNPSDDTFGGIRYPARLDIPSVPQTLSNPVNGITLSPGFSATVANNDGLFDPQEATNIVNNPVTIWKSTATPATRDTFKRIKEGIIENVKLSLDSFRIEGADIYRSLQEPVTRTFEEAGLLGGGESIPIAYGPHFKEKLIEITEGQFVACDPEYLTEVVDVYDSDGFSVAFTVTDGVIFAGTEATTVDFVGITENSIGAIITREMGLKAELAYESFYWNTDETDNYIDTSYEISLYIADGDLQSLIAKALKNDMAFLIQQHDGRLTIRRWGDDYGQHSIASWTQTQEPAKTLSSHKYYSSSVVVAYNKVAGDLVDKHLNADNEPETVARWKKKTRITHETDHRYESTATDFSGALLGRFGNRAELVDMSTGDDTSSIEMLDRLTAEIEVNGRVLTPVTNWRVVGVDPAQDTLELEEFIEPPAPPRDIPISHPSIAGESGYLAQPSIENDPGLMSEPVKA
jgi:hypothetical protein